MEVTTGYKKALELIEECIQTKDPVLDLGYLGLHEVPSELRKCEHIEGLNLSPFTLDQIEEGLEDIDNDIFKFNQLSHIPTFFSSFKKLEWLILSGNKIEQVEELGSLTNLQWLDISGNEIEEVEGLGSLTNLLYLGLSGNKIEQVEGLGSLTNLQDLDISENKIEQVEGLGSLTNLQNLDISENKIEQVEGLQSLVNLQKLDISGNKIEQIEGLGSLTNLQEISLSGNKIIGLDILGNLRKVIISNAVKKIEVLDSLTNLQDLAIINSEIEGIEGIDSLTNLQGLTISHSNIERIEVGSLTNLQGLTISHSNIERIEGLGSLTNLQDLAIIDSKIERIEGLGSLTNLQDLVIIETNIEQIEGLQSLVNLQRLDISGNNIEQIEGLQSLVNLQRLDISGNKIEQVEGLGSLTNLQDLDISGNKIEQVEGLGSLTNLQDLDISGNKIEQIEGLQSLVNLQKLDISGNKIEQIEGLQSLVNLQKLYISGNKIEQIEGLQSLVNLQKLDISRNKIEQIEGLQSLVNLQKLDISENKIERIEGLQSLVNLQRLDISRNKIEQIDYQNFYTQIKCLCIYSNPIKNVPSEILTGISSLYDQNDCLPDLIQWFLELEKGTIPNYYFKFLIMGNGRVGKSSIVDVLKSRGFDEEKKSTHAILLEKWETPNIKNQPSLQYFIWDFGGQEIYHSTHRWFMSSRAVFMIVWERSIESEPRICDPITGLDYDNHTIPYWINTIRSKNPDIPILLVENQIDEYNFEPKFLKDSELPTKYRANLLTTAFSAKKSERYLPIITHQIIQITRQLDEYGQEMPKSWHQLRKRVLDSIFTESGKPERQRITLKEFEELCLQEKVLSSSIPALLRFLHRTGIVYTDEDLLQDVIILDQQWAISAIYKLLDRESDFFQDTLNDRKGRFRQRQLFNEWGDEYTTLDKKLFLTYMLSCDLCFPIKENSQEERNNIYALPQLMSYHPPQRVVNKWEGQQQEICYIEYEYNFLHYASVQSFIVRMGNKTSLDFMWKNGIDIPHKGSSVLVTADLPQKIIQIRAKGVQREYLLSAVRNDFRKNVFDSDLEVNVRVSNDGEFYANLLELERLNKANNQNVLTLNRRTKEEKNLPVSSLKWALRIDEKADLNKIPDNPKIAISGIDEVSTDKPLDSNPFIPKPPVTVTDEGAFMKIEISKDFNRGSDSKLDKVIANQDDLKSGQDGMIKNQEIILDSLDGQSKYLFKKLGDDKFEGNLIASIEKLNEQQSEDISILIIDQLDEIFKESNLEIDNELKKIYNNLKKTDKSELKLEIGLPLLHLLGIDFKYKFDVKKWSKEMARKHRNTIF